MGSEMCIRDRCWLRKLGINIKGQIVDTMIAASLVDENRFRYDLMVYQETILVKVKMKVLYMKLQSLGV